MWQLTKLNQRFCKCILVFKTSSSKCGNMGMHLPLPYFFLGQLHFVSIQKNSWEIKRDISRDDVFNQDFKELMGVLLLYLCWQEIKKKNKTVSRTLCTWEKVAAGSFVTKQSALRPLCLYSGYQMFHLNYFIRLLFIIFFHVEHLLKRASTRDASEVFLYCVLEQKSEKNHVMRTGVPLPSTGEGGKWEMENTNNRS